MRAAVLRGPGDLSVENIDEPLCPERGAVIEVIACAVCPTDIKMVRAGQKDLTYPRVLGHEVVGTVEKTCSSNLHVGDTVQIWPGIPCGRCPSCLRGWDNMCSAQGIVGFNRDGGFAERMAVPGELIDGHGANILPDGLDPVMATLTEPLACCVHGQHLARIEASDSVAIFGAGPMGLMHTALAHSKGARVMVVEPDQRRREVALHMGAEHAVDPAREPFEAIVEWTAKRGADVAVLATPEVKMDDRLLRAMAPRGRICAFSGLKRGSSQSDVDINILHYRELTLVGAYGCTCASDTEALRTLASGRLDLRPLISRRMSLGSIEEAFTLIEERVALKCVIDDMKR